MTTFTYDDAGRMLSEEKPDGSLTQYEYTTAGKFVKYTDANDKQVEITDAIGGESSVIYDSMGRVSISKDKRGAQTSYEHGWGGNIFKYSYDMLNRLVSYTYGEG